MKHVIKILEPYADAIAEGRKTFEVRYNDRGYNAGDIVEFNVRNNSGVPMPHDLDDKEFKITFVHSGLGLNEGYVVFGIKEIGKGDDYGSSNDD